MVVSAQLRIIVKIIKKFESSIKLNVTSKSNSEVLGFFAFKLQAPRAARAQREGAEMHVVRVAVTRGCARLQKWAANGRFVCKLYTERVGEGEKIRYKCANVSEY